VTKEEFEEWVERAKKEFSYNMRGVMPALSGHPYNESY
jgi:hypothetical protein